MNLDKDIEGFIKTIKEEPDKCDVSFEEMQINLGGFLEPKQELNEEEIMRQSTEKIYIVDPLENIQVKTEPELCLEDNLPLKNFQVKTEPELCLNSSVLDDNETALQRKFSFNLICFFFG